MKFINDLNKLVNTIDKVDRLLTVKEKRPKSKYFTFRVKEEDLQYLRMMAECAYDNECNLDDEDTKYLNFIINFRKKLK